MSNDDASSSSSMAGKLTREPSQNDPLKMQQFAANQIPLTYNQPTIRASSQSTTQIPARSDYNSLPPPPPPEKKLPLLTSSVDETAEMMMHTFISKCKKFPMDTNAVPANALIQTFALSSAWKQVVDLSSKVNDTKTSSPISVTTRLRLEGLYRLKMFDDLSSEAGSVLVAERARFILMQKDSEAHIQCSNTMYALRLLLAEVKAMTGNGEDAFQQLYQFRDELEGQIKDDNASLLTNSYLDGSYWWKSRVTSSIINAAVRQRFWRIAVAELNDLLDSFRNEYRRLKSLPKSSGGEACNVSDACTREFHRVEIILLCRLSRLLLQIGAMKASHSFFDLSLSTLKKLTGESTSKPQLLDDISCQVNLIKGLMLFGQDQYEDAMEIFNDIINKENSKRMVSTDTMSLFENGPPDSGSFLWDIHGNVTLNFNFDSIITLEESVLSAAVNNYSICALYLRRISVAIERLEGLIKEDPVRHLTDPVVFNLCTLYDLSCSPDVSTLKKKVLQKLSARYHVDDPILHWRSFRLN